MAQIAVAPIVLKDLRLKIGADNYEKAITQVVFKPSSSKVEFRGGTPDAVFTDSTPDTWTCEITYAQDWETASSFSKYLFANAGTTKACEFIPRSGTGLPKVSANLAIVHGPIGGSVGAFITGSVTCGSDKPVLGVAT